MPLHAAYLRPLILTVVALALGTGATGAGAEEVDLPFAESFDDEQTAVSFGFNDGQTPNPEEQAWRIADGEARFANESDFRDVGVALVTTRREQATSPFVLQARFRVGQIDYTGPTQVGLVALASRAEQYTAAGLLGRVEAIGTTTNRYRLVLARDGQQLAVSDEFDLTDGSPDFTLTLAARPHADGGLDVLLRFEDAGAHREPINLTGVVADEDRPRGRDFGVRLQPGFNRFTVGVEELRLAAETVTDWE
jgi:hypothetical protein